ncbi:MAG: mechanosensitive ion channel family protein [Gammaproteobacteria bacterium]|nr:mechanosensitive ion channel family protein [Gammaproteobacteria bacterium]
MDFHSVQQWMTELLGKETWIIQVFIVVLAMLIINFMQKRALGRVMRRAEKTSNLWDDAFISALERPLSLLVWVVGLTLAADIIHDHTKTSLFEVVPAIRNVGVIASLTWFLVRFISAGEKNIIVQAKARPDAMDETTVIAIGKLLRLSIIITGVLVILQTLGFSISGVLAFGGIGGIAVGFAAKDLLANFFGGLMIYLDRPFSVGDWVRSPDKEIEGTVENIGWRLTRIRTFDKRPLYVPNSIFTSIAVENPSRMTNRRIYETIGIRYDDAGKMDVIVADVIDMLKAHEAIDTSQTLIVNFNSFAPSSLDFFVYTFTRTTNWVKFHEIKQDVLLKILNIIEGHGAQIAFPTSTLHVDSLPDTNA